MKLSTSFIALLFVLSRLYGQISAPTYKTENGTEVKILCWNIYMLPWLNKGQWGRIHHIEQHLKENDYDVLVLQEVFLERMKHRLIKTLSEQYPFYAGPPGKDFGLFGQDGGVMIFSKHPIVRQESIVYDEGCKGADCLSQKGAVFVEIQKGSTRFQVIGTHLQSMSDKECQKIRDRQMCSIYTDLLQKHETPQVPQFIVGDLNTECHIPQRYLRMLALLDAKDAAKSHEYFTISPKNKFKEKDNEQTTLDYILFRANQAFVHVKHGFIKIFKGKWSEDNDDLSDHYAVEAVFLIENTD